MLAIESPIPLYFDRDGLPLDDGSLFFGAPNLNPETNPITVYWDSAGTQPAAQPIRTINGYAARSGAPGILFSEADYSLTVKDKPGRLIFYQATTTNGSAGLLSAALADSSSDGNGAARVAYRDPVAPAYLKTVSDIISGIPVSVYRFMSKTLAADTRLPSPTMDCTAALALAHSTGVVIDYQRGIYTFSKFEMPMGGGIRGRGAGQTFLVSTDTTTGHAINYTSELAFPIFEDFRLSGPGSSVKAGGAGIALNPGPSQVVSFATFEGLLIHGFPINADLIRASGWLFDNVYSVDFLTAAIRIQDIDHVDTGDNTITSCIFDAANHTPSACVIWQTGGGLQFTDNKVLYAQYGVLMQGIGDESTSDIFIRGNSIEHASVAGVAFSRTSGSITLGNIDVSNNQIADCTMAIQFSCPAGFIQNVNVGRNVLTLNDGQDGIDLANVTGYYLGENVIQGSTGNTGIRIDAGCSYGKVGVNSQKDVATPLVNLSTTTTVVLDVQTGNVTGPASSTYGTSLFAAIIDVTFPRPFFGVPHVDITIDSANGCVSAAADNITATGFRAVLIGAASGGVLIGRWTARGVVI